MGANPRQHLYLLYCAVMMDNIALFVIIKISTYVLYKMLINVEIKVNASEFFSPKIVRRKICSLAKRPGKGQIGKRKKLVDSNQPIQWKRVTAPLSVLNANSLLSSLRNDHMWSIKIHTRQPKYCTSLKTHNIPPRQSSSHLAFTPQGQCCNAAHRGCILGPS